MGIPLIQKYRIGRYLLTQKLRGRERFPLVLMLEPLFQCNLACAGCGKIEHPKEVLQRRMSVEQALAAVDECDAPVISIPGGEPLIHRQLPQIVAGIIARRKFVYLCTNALLLAKHIDEYRPSRYLAFSIHLDGNRERHDASVCQQGVYDKAVAAIRLARSKGFRVTVNCTLFAGEDASQVAAFFDEVMRLDIEGITVSPGYSYQRAPRQDVFLGRAASKRLFRDIFRAGRRDRSRWAFTNTSLFLDFLAGNQTYQCTPWSNPTYNLFGWQRPCYLLDEGYASSFRSLMEDTDWDHYGVGRNARCDNCMAHCGYEGTAVNDMLAHPLKAMRVSLRGPRVSGPMAPELPVLYASRPEPPTAVIPVTAIRHAARGDRARER
ncbi:adenosyl-hopene transferase HpnH [Steroidobacter cummioxidans]|uniref:adenosyl-hopene transferase HpnH n=1 Tax=Steroidobacter cummioxidans TaxID=1803913 RepID=UPI000E31ECF9|nr:adenosyl-hopene transferase HpnH [Steroidobacter cummioxidans]